MSWMNYISIVCIIISLCSLWVALCVRRTTKAMTALSDDLIEFIQSSKNTEESHRANLLFNELHEIAHFDYFGRILFFRNPNSLFDPGLQALLEGGSTCGRLHSERWWNMYEKIYLTAPSSWQKNINYLITKPNYSLEDALIAYNYNIDATLYPDGPTTSQAMLAACEEYDDAMAAQEIMNG